MKIKIDDINCMEWYKLKDDEKEREGRKFSGEPKKSVSSWWTWINEGDTRQRLKDKGWETDRLVLASIR